MAVNSETGKPRGFCFVEYDDAATALSAIRNLNGRDVGGRDLRVNFSNNSALVDYASRGGSGREKTGSQLSATDITARLSDREVWDVVSEAKRLAEEEQATAEKLREKIQADAEQLREKEKAAAEQNRDPVRPGVVFFLFPNSKRLLRQTGLLSDAV